MGPYVTHQTHSQGSVFLENEWEHIRPPVMA